MPARRRFPLVLERPAESVAAGEATPRYVDQTTVRADIEGLTVINRGGLTAEAEYRIDINYRADVTSRWRGRLGVEGQVSTRVFGFLSVVPDRFRRRLIILANELV